MPEPPIGKSPFSTNRPGSVPLFPRRAVIRLFREDVIDRLDRNSDFGIVGVIHPQRNDPLLLIDGTNGPEDSAIRHHVVVLFQGFGHLLRLFVTAPFRNDEEEIHRDQKEENHKNRAR